MASPPTTTTAAGATAATAVSPSSQPTRHPLRREGAIYLPTAAERASAAERAMEAAMLRSSSPPVEPALGKRVREGTDSEDHSDADADADADREGSAPFAETALPSPPSLSNVIAATMRYASRKKLRPEQRDEIEVFLSVIS